MKIKRYTARDMREALRQVREEQGADAVILSSKSTGDGVEVCAAADMEALMAAQNAAEGAAASEPFAPMAMLHQPPPEPDTPGLLGNELRSLRQLLENQLAALAWNDYTRREPYRARVLAELAQLGIAGDVARAIAEALPSTPDASLSQQLHLGLLARRVLTCGSPIERGGVYALIGPPGAGKTTLLAKLATRWVMSNGRAGLTLVSVDGERLGASEQLRCLGRVLNVPVHAVADATALRQVIQAEVGRELLLIDTPGHIKADVELQSALAALRADARALSCLLVLPASAQAGVIHAAIQASASLKPECALLSRVDEASSLGGALSALVRWRLPVALVGNGPAIPTDLAPARAHQLVARAVELARKAGASADEDLLARRHLEGHTHAAA